MGINGTFTWHTRIEDINRETWNALAEPLVTPFLEWDWLAALERTGCVHAEHGWQPCHLTLTIGKRLLAAAALYVKGHSWGEFVFDQQWAQASHGMGQTYYPKLVGMSPFTPATGYRFLIDPELDESSVCEAMMTAIDRFCEENRIMGCHFLHADGDWCATMQGLGFKPWLHHSLIWENRDFGNFADYVASFKSRQRNNIRRERKLVQEHMSFRVWQGEEAPADYFSTIYDFYESTCRKFQGWSHYLNRPFFEELGRHFKEKILFTTAHEERETDLPVAMSFLVRKRGRLYGRYWGTRANYNQLHFETCYYQAIEWAIKHGFSYFDAGSGSAQHKKRRGFPATPNYSLHRHYNTVMAQIWEQNIEAVNRQEADHIELINK